MLTLLLVQSMRLNYYVNCTHIIRFKSSTLLLVHALLSPCYQIILQEGIYFLLLNELFEDYRLLKYDAV